VVPSQKPTNVAINLGRNIISPTKSYIMYPPSIFLSITFAVRERGGKLVESPQQLRLIATLFAEPSHRVAFLKPLVNAAVLARSATAICRVWYLLKTFQGPQVLFESCVSFWAPGHFRALVWT
jgi:hypothetical protein